MQQYQHYGEFEYLLTHFISITLPA